MSKLKQPFLSLAAFGTFAKSLTLRRRGRDTLIGETPHPTDAQTFAQKQWRTMYQKAVALWHLLSPAEKAAWERQATPRHMIGFAYFISQALKPNPGLYLPLAGGVMAGEIDMATNRITDLPAPGAAADPLRQAELTAHAALATGIHGLLGETGFSAQQTTNYLIAPGTWTRVKFNTEAWDIGGYFNLTTERYTPLVAGKYLIAAAHYFVGLGANAYHILALRKNGTTYKELTRTRIGAAGDSQIGGAVIVALNGSTDYLELYTYHSDALNRWSAGLAYRVWFQGFLIAQT